MSTALLILTAITSIVAVAAAIIWILNLRRKLAESARNAAQPGADRLQRNGNSRQTN
ncbi:hypothetical protein HYU96_01380 [Candidatus Daviesbacteria bacterium]|nr:hypothetical protein [Candidatus Daviesbacteria bacterium]